MPDDSVDGMGGQAESTAPPGRSNRTVTPAIAAALVVLAASFALSVAFVLANGGLDLPAAQRPSRSTDAIGAVPSSTAQPTAVNSATVTPPRTGPAASPTAAAASSKPVAIGTAKPTAQPTTTPGTSPRASSNRYDLLTKCPSEADCWIYVVRQGDNLFSIARYFGVPLSVVEERNPWTKTTTLVAGQTLLLPPPTR